MFVFAHRTLLGLTDAGVSAPAVVAAARALDDACVALCDGQYADIGFEQMQIVTAGEYEAMIAGKTAALLGASAQIGALAANADPVRLAPFAIAAAISAWRSRSGTMCSGYPVISETTGKPVAVGDIRSRKKSFPVVLALERLPPPNAIG